MKGSVLCSVGLGLFLMAASGCCEHSKRHQCVETQTVKRQVVQQQIVQQQVVQNQSVEDRTVQRETVVERVVVREVPPPIKSERTVVVIQSPPPIDWSALICPDSGASAEEQIAIIEKIVAAGKAKGCSIEVIAFALSACRQVCGFNPSYAKVNCSACGLSQAVDWRRADLKQRYGLWCRDVFDVDYQTQCLIRMARDSYQGGCKDQIGKGYGYYHYPYPVKPRDRQQWGIHYRAGVTEVYTYYLVALNYLKSR